MKNVTVLSSFKIGKHNICMQLCSDPRRNRIKMANDTAVNTERICHMKIANPWIKMQFVMKLFHLHVCINGYDFVT